MKQSIVSVFKEVVSEFTVNLDSTHHLEVEFCITKMFDKFDLSDMNVYETKKFIERVYEFVYSQFNSLPL